MRFPPGPGSSSYTISAYVTAVYSCNRDPRPPVYQNQYVSYIRVLQLYQTIKVSSMTAQTTDSTVVQIPACYATRVHAWISSSALII